MHKLVAALGLSMALPAVSAAAPILPVSYTLSVPPNSGYPDTLGVELIDGILATGTVNLPEVEGVPYVAWDQDASVTITFQFNQSYLFDQIQIGALRSDVFNFAGLPPSVSIAGQNFSVAATAIPNNTRGFLNFTPVGLTANSVSIQLTRPTGLWLLLDEIRFSGTVPTAPPPTGNEVPEPSTWMLTLAPLAAAGLRQLRRRTR